MIKKLILTLCLAFGCSLASNNADSYMMTGVAQYQKGNYSEALNYFVKALEIQEKTLGENHPDTAISYNGMASAYRGLGNYKKALKYYKKTLSIREKTLGENHPHTVMMYDSIGSIYKELDDYEQALKYHKKALEIQEKTLGENHPDTAIGYGNIGSLYANLGDYKEALRYLKKYLSIKEKTLGENHPDTATTYNTIGSIYLKKLHDYEQALKYHKKALEIQEKTLGVNHPDTAISYNNIGSIYNLLANYKEAMNYHKKALEIKERILGVNHPDTAASYNNIGLLYSNLGNYEEALKYHKKALSIQEKSSDANRLDTAAGYNNIGSIYNELANYKEALNYFRKALEIQEEELGENHPDTAASYNNIGFAYSGLGNYSEALNYYKKVLAIFEKSLGINHPDIATSYNNIGLVYNRLGNYQEAYINSQKAYKIYKFNQDKNFEILSNREKKIFLEKNSQYMPNLLSSGYKYASSSTDPKSLKQEIYEMFINDKDSLLDSENILTTIKSLSKDRNTIAKIEKLDSLKRAYAKLSANTPKEMNEVEQYNKNMVNLAREIDETEIELSKLLPKFKEAYNIKELKLGDLGMYLDKNELFVDFGYYQNSYFIFSYDKNGVVEFTMLDKDKSAVLNDKIKSFRSDIDSIINSSEINSEFLSKITAKSKETLLYIYSIIIKDTALKDRTSKYSSLIISPDGALRLLPFEALYNGKNYLIETKDIRYASSAKEFIRTHRYNVKEPSGSAVIFSDPDYQKTSGSKITMASDTPNTSMSLQTRAYRSLGTFKRLPGFAKEQKVLEDNLKNPELFARLDANEENLFKLNSPDILHIITHGFFINDDEVQNPMLKSGIALSGANYGIKHQTDDGLVNALKLSGLSLEGTNLVVLSACETGLVDMNNTGSIASLPKTFIQSGAKNVMMSLWEVDDEHTVKLMGNFYKDKNYNKSLKNSKLKMIEQNLHPFFWASFILSGK